MPRNFHRIQFFSLRFSYGLLMVSLIVTHDINCGKIVAITSFWFPNKALLMYSSYLVLNSRSGPGRSDTGNSIYLLF